MFSSFNMFNPVNEKKSIELIEAAMDGDLNTVEKLIPNADVNFVDEYGDTALTQAAFNGRKINS